MKYIYQSCFKKISNIYFLIDQLKTRTQKFYINYIIVFFILKYIEIIIFYFFKVFLKINTLK